MHELVIALVFLTACSSAIAQTSPMSQDLTAVIRNGDIDTARTLIKNGASVQSLDKDGISPLVSAVVVSGTKPGATEIIDLLLNSGANIEQRSPVAPLDAAARFGSLGIVKFLLDKGANANAGANDGRTPLYQALRHWRTEVANMLIQRGADVNAKTEEGWTPLHLAAINGMESTVRLLLANGAAVNARDNQGATPLAWAIGKGPKDIGRSSARPELIEVLVKSGATE